MSDLLSPSDLQTHKDSVPEWALEGKEIHRVFKLADFPAALAFVNAVGALAEEAKHHPDIDIRWNKVTLRLSTHSKGGLTLLDFALAKKIDLLGPPPAHPEHP